MMKSVKCTRYDEICKNFMLIKHKNVQNSDILQMYGIYCKINKIKRWIYKYILRGYKEDL